MFIDQIKIHVKSGKGGDGCVSFRREKYIPRGGPDGGDGGLGGDVILKASYKRPNLSHLYHIPSFKAGNGQNGRGKKQYGKNGNDLVIQVPKGTVVYKLETSHEKSLLGELMQDEESLTVLKGGKSGRGNARFKSPEDRAPLTWEAGEREKSIKLLLELKLIADVGLVGYPNAGKSTLLSQLSNAKPKIASYPFTTLAPNLGVAHIEDKNFTIADIPGIIDGAHEGKGLGLKFLRHIERTRTLIFVLDVTKDFLNDYNTLREELKKYNPRILKKQSIIVLNKTDLIKNKHPQIINYKFKNAISISALNGTGIDKLRTKLNKEL